MAQNRMKGATAKEVFERIDRDGGGELDRRETRRALKELGIDPDSKLVQRQIKKFDEDGSGTLDLEEFEAFVSSILSADDDPAAASILAAFDNMQHMTGVSIGDRMGLVRSAKVHAFSANQLVMAYPPDPALGHLSFSHDHVTLVLSGSARLLLARGKPKQSRLRVAVPNEVAVRSALGDPLAPVATLSPLTCIVGNLLPHLLLSPSAAALSPRGVVEQAAGSY